MANYSDLLPDILPHVAKCPMPSITRAVQVVAQDYFQRSEAWTHQLPPTDVINAVSATTVSLPADTRLVVPKTLFVAGERLATTNEEMLALSFGDWRSQSDTPRYVMIDDYIGDQLILAVTPNATISNGLTGTVAVKPVRSAVELPAEIMETHGDRLVDGVLARLLMMKNTEWYDSNLAMYHKAEYERGIDEAHGVSNKANTSRVMSTGYGGI
jgi:hypothetical protein